MRASNLEVVMKSAEHTRLHITKHRRPHLAQEYIDTGRHEDAEGICFRLLPYARLCAQGKVTPEYAMRYRAATA